MSNASDFIADSTTAAAAAIVASNHLIADAMGYSALPQAYKDEIHQQISWVWGTGSLITVGQPTEGMWVSDPVTHLYQGTWNADTNTPALVSSTGTENHWYYCDTVGTTNLDGTANWQITSQATFKDGTWYDAKYGPNGELDLTNQTTATTIFANKVANALWLEHEQEFPWRITSYSLEECEGLFDPNTVFYGGWDTASSPYVTFHGLADYDTEGTYQTALTVFTGYTHRNAKTTVGKLLDECTIEDTYGCVHQSSGGVWNDPTGVLSPAQMLAAGNKRTTTDLYISRQGCHSGGPIVAALCRSINIPVKEYHAILDGTSHHSLGFPSIRLRPKSSNLFFIPTYDNAASGAVMMHGDDLYNTPLKNCDGYTKLAPIGFYNDNVFGQSAAEIELQVSRVNYNIVVENNLAFLVGQYTSNDWQYILDTYITPYVPLPANQADVDRLERDIKARAGEGQI